MKKQVYRAKLSFSKDDVYRERLTLNSSNNILVPQTEAQIAKVREIFGFSEKDMFTFSEKEMLGFFGGASNNMNTFDSSVTAANIMPKPEDFVNVPYRLLSATIVAGGTWRSTDFSDVSVLSASVSKLEGKPIYPNHDTSDVLNYVGIVRKPVWTPSFTDSKGKVVPGGIDGMMAIDAKTNPKIARGVLMGSIFSNSVTVDFEFEPSHHFADYRDFVEAIGTYAKDGKMVTRKATKIIDYYESSLVWLGADPYAKAIAENGDLINVDESSVVALSKESEDIQKEYTEKKKYFANVCFSKEDSASLFERFNLSADYKHNTDMNKYEKLLRTHFGLSDTDVITEDMVNQMKFLKVGEVVALEADITAKDNEIIQLKEQTKEVPTLKADIEANKEFVEIGKASLAAKRTEVTRLYSLSVDNKTDAAVVAMFEKADPAALDGFLAQYSKGLTQKFTGSCKKCGSQEISLQSSELGKLEEVIVEKEEIRASSSEEIRKKFSTK